MTELLSVLVGLVSLIGVPADSIVPSSDASLSSVLTTVESAVPVAAPELGVPEVDAVLGTIESTLGGIGVPLGSLPALPAL